MSLHSVCQRMDDYNFFIDCTGNWIVLAKHGTDFWSICQAAYFAKTKTVLNFTPLLTWIKEETNIFCSSNEITGFLFQGRFYDDEDLYGSDESDTETRMKETRMRSKSVPDEKVNDVMVSIWWCYGENIYFNLTEYNNFSYYLLIPGSNITFICDGICIAKSRECSSNHIYKVEY